MFGPKLLILACSFIYKYIDARRCLGAALSPLPPSECRRSRSSRGPQRSPWGRGS